MHYFQSFHNPIQTGGHLRVPLTKKLINFKTQGGGGSYFLSILFNEIQTMFLLRAKRSARVLPADLCTDHAHYVKNPRLTILRKNKNMTAQGGTFSHYYILVFRKFFGFIQHIAAYG